MARILISAGDQSGDMYGAALVQQILSRRPESEFFGLGGWRLLAAGVGLWGDIADLGTMGFVEVLSKVAGHAALLKKFKKEMSAEKVDLVILIDYPDFNLRIARAAHRVGVRVLYYVAPQLWAWRENRARVLRETVDHLAVIFPFEKEYFRSVDVDAEWVGHPLLELPRRPKATVARRQLGVAEGQQVIAILPGSRPHEISRLWPPFRNAANLLRVELPEAVFCVGADVGELPDGFVSCSDEVPSLLACADAAMCKSGTVSLETTLAEVPTVIAYRMHPLSYSLARRMVRVNHIGIVNVICDRSIVREFIQNDATALNIATEVLRLLRDKNYAEQQLVAFRKVREVLGSPGASKRVAAAALELIG